MAAGGAVDPEGKGTFLLYVDPERSRLTSKLWTGGKKFGPQELITSSVRPKSSASYLLTPTTQLIVCVSSANELRALSNDDEEWEDDDDISRHKVHPDGKVAAALGADQHVRVLFQDPSKRLILLDRVDESWKPTVLPANPIEGSPFGTSTAEDKLHIFYISADDHYMHQVVQEADGSWKDRVFASCSFEEEKLTPKRFMVTRNPESNTFEVYVLTVRNALLKITQDGETSNGELKVLGNVDDKGEFVAGTSAQFAGYIWMPVTSYVRVAVNWNFAGGWGW